jgi:hypothetical protein
MTDSYGVREVLRPMRKAGIQITRYDEDDDEDEDASEGKEPGAAPDNRMRLVKRVRQLTERCCAAMMNARRAPALNVQALWTK